MAEEPQNKLIPINMEEFIPIKATPKEKIELMKKRIQERTNSLNAKHAHNMNQPQYKTEVQALSKLPGGGVVVGKLTEDEIRGMKEHNDALLRKAMILRERARQAAKDRWGLRSK